MKGDRVTIGEAEKTVVLTRPGAADRYEAAVNAINKSHYKRGKRVGIFLGSTGTLLLIVALIAMALVTR